MLALIKKDLQIIFSSKRFILFLIAYIPFMLMLLGDSQGKFIFLVIIITYVYMVTTMPFNYEITASPHIFIQSLPVKKRDIVISKYILLFINFITSTVLATGGLTIIRKIGFSQGEYFNIDMLKLALPISMIMLSFSLPAFFRLSPKMANMCNMLIYILTMNSYLLNEGFLEKIFKNPSLGQYNAFNFTLVAIIIMLISMSISIWLYKNRDLV